MQSPWGGGVGFFRGMAVPRRKNTFTAHTARFLEGRPLCTFPNVLYKTLSLGLYTTPQLSGGGGGRFLGVCTMNKLLHTGVWQHRTHLLQIHHQQHRSPLAVQE